MRYYKYLIIISVTTLFFQCQNEEIPINYIIQTSSTSNKIDSIIIIEREQLRNYAFCECVRKFYSKPNFEETYIDGSAGGYLNLSYGHELEVFHQIDSFTVEYMKKPQGIGPGWAGARLGLMRCLNYRESEELEKFIIDADKYLNKGWLEENIK